MQSCQAMLRASSPSHTPESAAKRTVLFQHVFQLRMNSHHGPRLSLCMPPLPTLRRAIDPRLTDCNSRRTRIRGRETEKWRYPQVSIAASNGPWPTRKLEPRSQLRLLQRRKLRRRERLSGLRIPISLPHRSRQVDFPRGGFALVSAFCFNVRLFSFVQTAGP